MIVEVNTDNNIRGTENLIAQVKGIIEDSLSKYAQRLTRVVVHLSDTNGPKVGVMDKRCLIEARMEHMPSLAVSHFDDDLILSVHGACERMERVLDTAIGKLRARPRDEVHFEETREELSP